MINSESHVRPWKKGDVVENHLYGRGEVMGDPQGSSVVYVVLNEGAILSLHVTPKGLYHANSNTYFACPAPGGS